MRGNFDYWLQVAKFEHKGCSWHSVEQCYQAPAFYHFLFPLEQIQKQQQSNVTRHLNMTLNPGNEV